VREKKLRGLFLEVSFPEGRPTGLLFGHLTPSWMLKELHHLARLADPAQPVKLSLERGSMPQEQIAQQLQALNDLGVRFVIPEQGQRIEF
jgi:3',5'-cyclic-nucleotide phosphodiesterase